ncbi:MAG: aminotransferase class III-fold pyridoxal phosphate-dependent enzyme [Alphaproteobacteria bacterium]|nr:aminotransferase class III-fold pyridoxal phosphate-dependent enzyme [Alphaproteobacteria bacterium]MBL6938726.1 aminotransferase class III-fold pyridoxal phosphate-dependent enzyme [Alphaproteobacteria bacterium]MBL7097917.1 aminotransferase class III-fold pyridoxal phosphate-dependent enzyme [Alphaproteobacteria bacterium]
MPLSNAQMRDVNAVLHPYTNLVKFRETGPMVIERGQGVRVYDENGKDYIEAMAGLWCTALGWGENELAETAAAQMKKLSFGHLFGGKSHEPAIALAEKLKEVAPFPVGKVFFANSGSEANDTQVKLHWYAANARGEAKRKKILSRTKAYHGVTLASASLTGLANNHRSFDLPFDFARYADCPHYYRNAEPGETEQQFSARMGANLNALIEREGPDTIAAMIVEPVMGAGGVILPPDGYFDAVTQVLEKHGIPLIADEVITGFGRTGNWFGATTYGFEPDSMSIAKALSSAYLPISAVLLSPELSDMIEQESGKIGTFGHGFTYTGHPVAAAVALKTIEIYQRRDLVGHVRHVAPLFQKRLAKLAEHPLVGEAAGIGLIGAIELVANKKTKQNFEPARQAGATLMNFAQEEGLIVRALLGDRVALCPPLVITEAEINELFDRLERALAKSLDWAAKEKLIAA